MRFPDRPLVTAGLGVAFALLILVALSSPALFQIVMSPSSSNGPGVPNGSLQVPSTTSAMTAVDTVANVPNGTASTVTFSATTMASTSSAVPNSFATATSNSLTTSNSESTSIGAFTTVSAVAASTSTSAPTTSTYLATVTPTTSVQSAATPAGANSQGLLPGSTFGPNGSSLYVYAYKFGIIGAVALVIAFVAAFTVYRRVNASE
jgi:hypothetical protein